MTSNGRRLLQTDARSGSALYADSAKSACVSYEIVYCVRKSDGKVLGSFRQADWAGWEHWRWGATPLALHAQATARGATLPPAELPYGTGRTTATLGGAGATCARPQRNLLAR